MVGAKGHPSLALGTGCSRESVAGHQFGKPPLLPCDNHWLHKQMPPQKAKRVRS